MLYLLFLSLILFISCALATDDILFTSSVSYCQPPQSLLVQQFDIAYFSSNRSVSFNISAQSVSTNVSLSANIFLNVYGMQPLNLTIDLCDVLSGALCPLPGYNFQGSESITLPDSLGVENRLPDIAFKIPDLEAFAQLTLSEAGTDEVKACVQATLSNGWSTRQPAVEWSTRAFALITLLLAIYTSTSPQSLLPFRFIDLICLFQSIALNGLLSLNFPSIYRSFTLNFSWAIGLFPPKPPSSLQRSIDNMRALTGGQMANSTSDSAIGLVNRKLSPYNTPSSLATLSRSLGSFASFAYSQLSTNTRFIANAVSIPTAGNVEIITDANTLEAGIPIYTNSVHIGTANAFMTVFFSSLIVLAIVGGLLAIGYVVFRLAARHSSSPRMIYSITAYTTLSRAWALRTLLILFTPIFVFAFHQWTLKDSWLSILLSVLSILGITAGIIHPLFLTFRLARQTSPQELFTRPDFLAAHTPLFGIYQTQRYWFSCFPLGSALLRAVIVGFGQNGPKSQVAILITIELLLLITHVIFKPHSGRGADVFATYLAITRFVCAGLMVAFIESLSVAAIPRVVIGVITAVIFSVAVIVSFFNFCWHFVQLFSRTSKSGVDPTSNVSLMEKARQPTPSPTTSLRPSLLPTLQRD